jgi:hypothetical protein
MKATRQTSIISGFFLGLFIPLAELELVPDLVFPLLFLTLAVVFVAGVPQIRGVHENIKQHGRWAVYRSPEYTRHCLHVWGRMSLFGISAVTTALVIQLLAS